MSTENPREMSLPQIQQVHRMLSRGITDLNVCRIAGLIALGQEDGFTDFEAALNDMQTAVNAMKQAAAEISDHREAVRLRELAATCQAPQNDCHYFPAADDQCRVPAMLHTEFCAKHQDQAANDWYEAHEVTDHCAFHCEGADHLVDGELIEEVKVA
ncbi:hypothetical protein [Nesterenkonia sandarakina]|uniref:Uncharacterized protein n=1 Tax=Nesterenkonia sandarakina TaxID=272918 RepID=A0A2T0YJ10_9MICC|nr:hypothetical protein [Nesterenkonia sandarakina]PRZ15177.1 hypothetical protein BCL67_10998 [Nesterenkonia sandarakina]